MNAKPALNITFLSLILLGGCSKTEEASSPAPKTSQSSLASEPTASLDPEIAQIKKAYPDALSTDSGLHYIVRKEGSGEDTPMRGDTVFAHYKGTLMSGLKFDSSYDRGRPFPFQVGLGQVIKGWDEAFLEMKKGEKRTLIIPSKLGYGTSGAGGTIPPNATLIFEVELVDFK